MDSDELNFQNAISLKEITVAQPRMLITQLKEYQLKGLNSLATLYQQGINGIWQMRWALVRCVAEIYMKVMLIPR